MPTHIPDIHIQFEQELAVRTPLIQPPPTSVIGVTPGNLGLSNNFIMAAYGAPGWIVELPFKAVPYGDNPDGLLAESCWNFGCLCVEALNTIVSYIGWRKVMRISDMNWM